MLTVRCTASLQADCSLQVLSKWVNTSDKRRRFSTLTEEEQKGQKQQQEPPEFGKASETQRHTSHMGTAGREPVTFLMFLSSSSYLIFIVLQKIIRSEYLNLQ